jgi:hypothetical protein
METIVTLQLPLKRIPPAQCRRLLPFRFRWFGWLFEWSGGSVQEFGGSRVNTVRHLQLFRWHLLTIRRNQYHDQSDEERADEFLAKWSTAEKQLRMFRLKALGEDCADDIRQLIDESLGIDLEEGTIR